VRNGQYDGRTQRIERVPARPHGSLHGTPLATVAADALTTQQQKMTSSNKEAGAKKLESDARKKFLSECRTG